MKQNSTAGFLLSVVIPSASMVQGGRRTPAGLGAGGDGWVPLCSLHAPRQLIKAAGLGSLGCILKRPSAPTSQQTSHSGRVWPAIKRELAGTAPVGPPASSGQTPKPLCGEGLPPEVPSLRYFSYQPEPFGVNFCGAFTQLSHGKQVY